MDPQRMETHLRVEDITYDCATTQTCRIMSSSARHTSETAGTVDGSDDNGAIDYSFTQEISRKKLLDKELSSNGGCRHDGAGSNVDVCSERLPVSKSWEEGRSSGTRTNHFDFEDVALDDEATGQSRWKDVSGHERGNTWDAHSSGGKDGSGFRRTSSSAGEFDVNEEGIKKYDNNSRAVFSKGNCQTQEQIHIMVGSVIKSGCIVAGKDPSQVDTDVLCFSKVDKVALVNAPPESYQIKEDGFRKMDSKTHPGSSSDSLSKLEERVHDCLESTELRSEKSSSPRNKDIDSVFQKKSCELVSSSESDIHGISHEPSDAQAADELCDKPAKYKCLKCSRIMKDRRLVENHSCDKESDEEKVKITIMLDNDKKSFVCKECDYSGSGHSFEEHLMCHLMVRPYQCLYCKECFINRKEISRHVLKSHDGAKMSCALRALRKAKALIREVTTSGTISFMAKVAGKVPLEKDPDKKKKIDSDNSEQSVSGSDQSAQNMTQSVQGHHNVTESDHSHQNMTESDHSHHNMTESDHSHQNMPESDQNSQTIMVLEHDNQDILCNDQKMTEPYQLHQKMTKSADKNADISQKSSVSDTSMITALPSNEPEVTETQQSSENQQGFNPFSKLRHVLTSGSSTIISKTSEEDTLNFSKSEDNSDSEKSCSDSGLKIVASFSLQNMEPQEYESERVNIENTIEPALVMSSLENVKEGSSSYALHRMQEGSERLSFLGPERPIFKPDNDNCTPLIPPPPLQPAAFQSLEMSSRTLVAGSVKQPELNTNFFVCGFNCLFSSLSAAEFQEHTVNFHSAETYFPCYYCGHRSPNETDLVRHISNHTQAHNRSAHLYVCGNDGCRFESNMIADYISHLKTKHPDIPDLLCYSCGDTFPECSMLQAHVEDNVIHIVNCPHCPSKATDRKAILAHISTAHPGRPKMVSVAKQLICHDRKMNNYGQMVQLQQMLPPALTPAPVFAASGSVIDQVLSRHDLNGDYVKSRGSSLSDILTSASSISPRDTPSPRAAPQNCEEREVTGENRKSPLSESSEFSSARMKEEIEEEADSPIVTVSESKSRYTLDDNGTRKRVYVPMSERQAENYRCKHCTFIARDFRRMLCHEKSHGVTPTRKERFRCMFCPQGFDSEMKFRLHITCHPGLIKFLLYRCKKCEFDTNQKHTMVRHITCNRDRKHRGFGPVEDQYTVVSRSLESRVLECERCDYMTRHKIHIALHYQREHNILRDRGEFTVEGIAPTDTPLSSYDLSPQDPTLSPSLYCSLKSPDSCHDDMFDFLKPSGSAKKSKDKVTLDNSVLTPTQITERNDLFNRMVSQQASLQPGQVLENQMRKFKCPICKYLLPKAADLKNHVKRHSEIGQITLVLFRCKYCSCMSTARELLYDHLAEKHPGKPIALVKKIVAIDTTEVDKSFAETSMDESLDQLEESLHKDIMSNLIPGSSQVPDHQKMLSSTNYEQLFVIPEGGETFSVPLHCPKCSYSSYSRSEIIVHVSSFHAEVKVIGSDEDVDNLVRTTKKDIQQQRAAFSEAESTKPLQASQEEVLIVPDDQIFKEPALCPRCDFTTLLRREMVIHLQQNHPDISVMGRNSYPVQVTAIGQLTGPLDESCVVGSGSLDNKLRCLYENYGTQMKCLICGADRPKKFFIHVHILRHLNIYLWKCAFCAHRGLQKYKMVDHIKKIHPGKPLSVRYLRINVEAKVAQFLDQFSAIRSRKASSDEGLESPFPLLSDDLSDQASNDSSRSRQKSPGPPGGVSSSSQHALGSDELDEKINCLYHNSGGAFYKCVACPNQFQRKFAMHRHIIMSHLKIALLACAYCSMEGVERHQIVDHILACHKPSPVSVVPLDIDLSVIVSDFLTKMAAGELRGETKHAGPVKSSCYGSLSSSKVQDSASFSFSKNKTKSGAFKLSTSLKATSLIFENADCDSSTLKKSTMADLDVLMLGRPVLDKELSCLYQEHPSGQVRCLVCRWEFPRKYPLHRHIMLKHLKINLVGCPYCPFEGIEKYNVSAHIKEDHDGKPVSIRYLQPDIEAKVRQFVEDISNFEDKDQDQTKSNSHLVVPKVERKDEQDDNNDDGNDRKTPDHGSHGGLVVAMFGKKKKQEGLAVDDAVVKTEVDEEDYEERSYIDTKNSDVEKEQEMPFHSHGEDEEGGCQDDDDDEDPDMYENTNDPTDDSKGFYPKQFRVGPYFSSSYRSPAGGKPKALDVITKIKVLKSKEGSIVKFYCEKCKFTSLHRSNIVRHIYKIHEKYQTHTCPMCSYQTLSLMLMQRHIEKEHPGVQYREDNFNLNLNRCKPRSKSFMGPLSFQKRRQILLSDNIAQKRPSTSSTSSSYNSSSYNSSSYNSNNPGPKLYACAYCHYETNTQEDILKHTKQSHSQGSDHSWEMKSPNTQKNVSKQQEDRFLACWDGSKKAVKRRLQDNYEAPVKRKRRFIFDKGNELIQCGHCDTKETSMSRMQDHLNWDHPGLPFQAKCIPAWRFICKSCAVKTMATSKMKYHLNRHVNYRPYTCTDCGAFFPSPDQCRRHSRSQGHEEQYTYVRQPKKETRVADLLEGTRQLALKVQEEATKDPNFDMSLADTFIAKFQETRNSLKRSAPTGNSKHSKKAKNKSAHGNEDDGEATEDELTKKQLLAKSLQTAGVEQDITIKCYNCEYVSSSVNNVSLHHNEAHPGKKFLWTEVERGFTCDRSGEALPDCDTVPSSSSDVGYTTRMTIGSGSNTMRFKCKTCNFSSCVIQAMKSHLKSHQPKGFICPYCSRSFSGKEKLMRHQYCLHKGQALWVIHLRMSGVTGSTAVKKGKNVSTEGSTSEIRSSTANNDKETGSIEKSSKKASQNVTVFLCSKCPFTSESMYHFRLHLAQQHEQFKHKTPEIPVDSPLRCSLCPFLAETETEYDDHVKTHVNNQSFQCGYCDFSACDQSSVEDHLSLYHSSLDPKILEQNVEVKEQGQNRKKWPLLVNFKPNVALERISDLVLSQYGYARSEEAGYSSEEKEGPEDDDDEPSEPFHEGSHTRRVSTDKLSSDDNGDDDERLMIVEGVSNKNEDRARDNESSGSEDDEIERNVRADNVNKQLNAGADNVNKQLDAGADSEQLVREFELGDDQTSCVLGSDMIMLQFGGMLADNDFQNENRDDSAQREMAGQDGNVDLTASLSGSSLVQSKDYTLFAAQETNDYDDEEEDDNYMAFGNDLTLPSPLPMISLGDGVAMSPGNMVSDVDDGDNGQEEGSVDTSSDMLLDV